MRLQRKLHSNTLKVSLLSVPANPIITEQAYMRAVIISWVGPSPSSWIAVMSCHDIRLTFSSAPNGGCREVYVIFPIFWLNNYRNICVLSLCCISRSKMQSWCWLALLDTQKHLFKVLQAITLYHWLTFDLEECIVELSVDRAFERDKRSSSFFNSMKIHGSYDQNAGDTNVLPLSASKIGGKIKPETQSHQPGPLISCGLRWLTSDFSMHT